MKLRKIIAAVAAGAVAVSMMAVNAFAATVTLNSDYPGAWAASAGISKADLEAVGGDVKVVVDFTIKAPLIGDINCLAKPMCTDISWDSLAESFTSDTAIRKDAGKDSFFVFDGTQESVKCEFVVPADVIAGLGDSGISFQVNDCYPTSAELTLADGPQGAMKTVTEDQSGAIIKGQTWEEATGGAPASDGDTTSATTGNVPAAVMVSVMAIAGAAAIASRRKQG